MVKGTRIFRFKMGCNASSQRSPEGRVLTAIAQAEAGATSVNLNGAYIGDAGATQLADMLRDNATVTAISFADNRVGDEGARALADGLEENATVAEMYLSDNRIRCWGMGCGRTRR